MTAGCADADAAVLLCVCVCVCVCWRACWRVCGMCGANVHVYTVDVLYMYVWICGGWCVWERVCVCGFMCLSWCGYAICMCMCVYVCMCGVQRPWGGWMPA